jgi:hypothetical protein
MKRAPLTTCVAVACATVSFGLLAVPPASAQPVCNNVISCAQVAVEAAQAAQRSAQNAIPTGAVMAFRLRECPSGWVIATDLAGRVIVGAGEGGKDQNNIALTERKFAQTGGEEAHKLTVDELASHTHRQQGFNGNDRAFAGQASGGNNLYASGGRDTEPTGGNKAHNTMPPFVVLTYLEKK